MHLMLINNAIITVKVTSDLKGKYGIFIYAHNLLVD